MIHKAKLDETCLFITFVYKQLQFTLLTASLMSKNKQVHFPFSGSDILKL